MSRDPNFCARLENPTWKTNITVTTMDVDQPSTTTAAGLPIVDREKVRLLSIDCPGVRAIYTAVQTAPFLIRMFLQAGGFHRISLFQDGPLPTADEQQIFTWCAALISVLAVRLTPAPVPQERRNAARGPYNPARRRPPDT
jgi:hypothetical protein